MRIATWNLWNDECCQAARNRDAAEILSHLDAVCIALQEVSAAFRDQYCLKSSSFPHCFYVSHPGEEEGLALLSKTPFLSTESLFVQGVPAIYAVADLHGLRCGITNVHLPWDSVRKREEMIVTINEFLTRKQADPQLQFLTGDFNGMDEHDSVDRFLRGAQSLHGCEVNPVWYDLALAHHARLGQTPPPTLDVVHNPRWKDSRSVYSPLRMDRIYVRPGEQTLRLNGVSLFGCGISPESGFSPSDHYGVLADLSAE